MHRREQSQWHSVVIDAVSWQQETFPRTDSGFPSNETSCLATPKTLADEPPSFRGWWRCCQTEASSVNENVNR